MAQPQTAKRSPRKGARIGPVSELSVFLKVKPGREQLIRDVFIQADPGGKPRPKDADRNRRPR